MSAGKRTRISGLQKLARGASLLLAVLAVALFNSGAHSAPESDLEVHLLSVEGVINPLTAQYLTRGLRQGAEANAEAVVIVLNTPGGLDTSMREITQAMLNSPVPVVVYVAPPGARAGSAGMFITIAAHVAAMAPGTNIGAAHPVGLGGETDPVMAGKLTEDAAAYARSIASVRGRNAAWAESAVRESISATAEEAVAQNVVDFIADDLGGLLTKLDGHTVITTRGETTLRTAEAGVIDKPMQLHERILQAITDPNIAYILFTIGVIGLIAELYNPGMLFPGITGAISVILAFVAFGSLPVNWAGLLLLLLAVGLFVAELMTEGIGILGIGALVAFVIGSLMLYSPVTPVSPVMPAVRVSPWVIATVTASFAAVFLLILQAFLKARRAPVQTGPEALIGRIGTATSDLTPEGTVRLEGEAWMAVADDDFARTGEKVQVVRVEGITIHVRKV